MAEQELQNWTPRKGEETTELLENLGLDEISTERLLNESKEILSLCGNPETSENDDAGLVFGYVQSGKTMSFTTVTALARDNDYQIIIVIAGISTPLVNQSTNRLMKDLRIDLRYDRKWIGVLKNPTGASARETIGTVLREWRNPTFPQDERRSILITVMKNTRHLQNLVEIFERLDLRNVPTLIIDDEGDQASLNTRARRNALDDITDDIFDPQIHLSTIHRRLDTLRSLLPHHTFLQYTATPQATLFINILNRLSPNFVQILTPGDAYVGGMTFFVQHRNLVRTIPRNEIPTSRNPLDEPPESLIYALKLFFLGVAIGKYRKVSRNRSMMIHPSRLQFDQGFYFVWIQSIKERFVLTLQQEDDDSDKQDLVAEFRVVYQDLIQTESDLPRFEDLIGRIAQTDRLEHSINSTKLELVNSARGKTPTINWRDNYSFILVGGQSMDRGFTVEGLTVTYMPRNIGVGNVDTIQQRARFFGYKRGYLGLCRIYLDQSTIDAYTHYVEHEEELRSSLMRDRLANKHLNDWERQAILSRAYRLARRNVFDTTFSRYDFGNHWFRISAPHDQANIIINNRQVFEEFIDNKRDLLQEDAGHERRTEEQKHYVLNTSLDDVFNNLLHKLRFTREDDSEGFTTLQSLIHIYLEQNPTSTAVIYVMKKGETRDRRLTSRDEIQQLFQGKNPRTGQVIYPGDVFIRDEERITVQIHKLNLVNRDTGEVFEDIYTIAVWTPEEVGKEVIQIGDPIQPN
ncbi:MAG: Z1 domain-containing protein [Chitinophagales bacterium]